MGIASGLAYLPYFDPDSMPRGLHILSTFVPMWVFAIAWFVSGVMVAVAAIRRRPGWGGVGLIVMMSMLWGSFLLIGWLLDVFYFHMNSRADTATIVYLGLATYIVGNVPPDPTPKSETVAEADK